MSELPVSWVETTLGDVTADSAQRVPAADEQFQYVDIASIDRATKQITSPQMLWGRDAPSRARKEIRAGDILVSMTRPNLNAVALVPPEFDRQIASTGFDVLRSIGVEPRWLFYVVRAQSFIDRMSELVQGALYPAVRSKDVRGYVAPLAPLNEQKRIADKLDAVLARVDACRERLDRVPAILKRFRQAVLAAATSGKLIEEWREAHDDSLTSEAKGSVTVSREALPPGWRWSCPEEIKARERYSLAIGPFGSNLKVTDYRPTGVPLVFVKEIRTRNFGGLGTKFISEEKALELAAHAIAGGDLLITKMGDPPGDTAIYPQGAPDAVITADCIKLRVNELVAHPVFVGLVIESPSFRERLREITVGIAQQKISLERLRRFPLQLAPITEQHEIVRRVEALFAYADRLEAHYTAARAQVERLTPTLLAKAFRGELVPQDPNDEPASGLLERIRASRAATGENPPRKVRTERKPMTTKLTTDTLKEIIRSLPTDQFTFDDLRRQVSADYETLKDVVFALLSEAPASVKQVFDTEAETMRLVRVKR